MINDYKSRGDLLGMSNKSRRPWSTLAATVGIALCVSGLYAFLGSRAENTETNTTITLEAHPSFINAGSEHTITAAALPQRQVPLQLPNRDTLASITDNSSQADVTKSEAQDSEEDSGPSEPRLKVSRQETPPVTAATVNLSRNGSADEVPINTSPATLDEEETTVSMDQGTWLEERVKPGDSLALIFSRLKLSATLLHRIINSSKEAGELAQIHPGETIRVRIDQQGELLELVHKQSAIRSLQILPDEEGFTAQTIDRSLEKRIATASGTITSSLYLSAQRAGLSDALTMELANIFGWDIDFALEIRAGDQFSLIYEEELLDEKKYRNGPILAAEFINQGKVFRAIRFEDKDGYSSYYSPEGNSMRKAFLRAPVDFRRISSRFTKARFHPVLGKKRPHKGVDYAAATGTPVKASGDGRVIFRGTKGGYGRTVILRHGSQYTTLYGHLSKFRRSVTNGSRVRQGQVIGYVGKSGLATGPHLHYEFRVNGVHRNPLTIKLPAAQPLAAKYRTQFLSISTPLMAQLDLISKTMVADAR